MPGPATEIATLPLNSGVDIDTPGSDGRGTIDGMIATLTKQKGYIGLHYGRRYENPDNLELAIDWESIESHKEFEKSEDYPPFTEKIGAIMSGPATINHAEFNKQFASAASAPAVEILTLYFPSNVDQRKVDDTVSAFLKIIEDTAEGFKGATSGWMDEEVEHEKVDGKAKAYAGAIGWQSVEAHMAYRETQAFKDSIGMIRGIAKASSMHHVKFTKA